GVVVHPADIRDRDGAGIVIQAIHDLFPWLRHLFADSVYNGPNLREALAKFGDWTPPGGYGLSTPPATMGCRAVDRTLACAQSKPSTGKGLRDSITSATA